MSRTAPFSPDDLGSIRTVALMCAWLCLALAISLPVLNALAWATATAESLPMKIAAKSAFPYGLQPWQRALGGALSMLPVLTMSWGLMRARRSLTVFAGGDLFAGEAVTGLRDFACACFWAAVAGLAAPTVLSLALTIANPPGMKQLTVGVNSTDVMALLTAGIFWVIAAAMARAGDLARENAEFV